jgi:putative endonuclease
LVILVLQLTGWPKLNAQVEGKTGASEWFVYIIEVEDGSYYTGVSTDVERRFKEHCSGKRGARYFLGRTPKAVVYIERGHDRSSAHRREAQIKKLNRKQKEELVCQGPDPDR